MKAVLLRTGSVPAQPSFLSGSPCFSLSVNSSGAGVFSFEKNNAASPRLSLHLEINRRNETPPASNIRRSSSESDIFRLETDFSGTTQACPGGVRSKSFDQSSCAGDWSESEIPEEELGFSGGGGGGSGDCRIGGLTGGNADRSKIGAYYREMLKSNPNNSLILRNYGKFLHEVERDTVKAEESYGRAILASGGDGDVLSLYANLIWETHRDEDRAKSYFDQAVQASPNDGMVLGSYAHFMWEAEEEEEERVRMDESTSSVVAAF